MRTIVIFLAVVITLAAQTQQATAEVAVAVESGPADGPPAPQTSARTQALPVSSATAVKEMLDKYARLSRDMDATGIAEMYARDGEIANPGQDVIKGRAAIEAFLRKFAQYKVLDYVLTPAATADDKNGVTQKGTFHQRVRTPEGQIVEASGTFTAEWILEDFIWHIRRMTTAPL